MVRNKILPIVNIKKYVYDKDLKANVEVLEEVKIVAPKPKIGAAPFIYAIFQGVSNWISSMSRPTINRVI